MTKLTDCYFFPREIVFALDVSKKIDANIYYYNLLLCIDGRIVIFIKWLYYTFKGFIW